MTRTEAALWAQEVMRNGVSRAQEQYRQRYEVGNMAEQYWHEMTFTFGVEYGILIALHKVFGDVGVVAKKEAP